MVRTTRVTVWLRISAREPPRDAAAPSTRRSTSLHRRRHFPPPALHPALPGAVVPLLTCANASAEPVVRRAAGGGAVGSSAPELGVETRRLWLTVEGSGLKWCAVEDPPWEGRERRCSMFFMGTYTPKLDDKGRLFLPAKFRDRLAEGLVVTQGQENCLVVWPTDVFMEEARRAQSTPMTVKGARDYARILFAGADEGTPDKQGRISIPSTLREYASLDRDVVVIGVMDRIEIWDPARWRDYSAGAQAKFAELDEQQAPTG